MASHDGPLSVNDDVEYLPIQSIGYDLGSKLMSGYFVQQGSSCVVTLMLIVKHSEEGTPQASAARLRLILDPGQIAGRDSDEGHSLNVTCGSGGAGRRCPSRPAAATCSWRARCTRPSLPCRRASRRPAGVIAAVGGSLVASLALAFGLALATVAVAAGDPPMGPVYRVVDGRVDAPT